MDFEPSKQQIELQERARETIVRNVAPIVEALPRGAKLSADQWRGIYRALKPLGYLGSTISRDLGGAGMHYVDYGMLLEALASGPLILGEIVPPRTINYLGTPEQKARWLPRLFEGEMVSTAAITEPQAGSDLRGLKTTAVEEGEGFRVDGAKKWIKLGGVSDLMTLLVVNAGTGEGRPRTSRLVLERAQSPWESRELEATGMEAISFAELRFKGVRVPKENLLGEAGLGAEQFNRGIEASRAFVALQSVGIARRALNTAIAYAKERFAFGRPLAKFQAIQIALADATAKLEASAVSSLSRISSPTSASGSYLACDSSSEISAGVAGCSTTILISNSSISPSSGLKRDSIVRSGPNVRLAAECIISSTALITIPLSIPFSLDTCSMTRFRSSCISPPRARPCARYRHLSQDWRRQPLATSG